MAAPVDRGDVRILHPENSEQRHSLALSDLAVNYGLFGGIGYLLGGWLGVACGGALITARFAWAVWVSARTPAAGAREGGSSNSEKDDERLSNP